MQRFETAKDAALALRPDVPVYCFRPDVLVADARQFMQAFPGETAYAVKTNGEPSFSKRWRRRREDLRRRIARRVRGRARRRARCRDALHASDQGAVRHSPRAGALRHPRDGARPRGRDRQDPAHRSRARSRSRQHHHLRAPADEGHAAYELSKKFGAAPAHAVELLQRCHKIGFKVGLCFHVGSQIEDPETYERALASADWVRNRADVPLAGSMSAAVSRRSTATTRAARSATCRASTRS